MLFAFFYDTQIMVTESTEMLVNSILW